MRGKNRCIILLILFLVGLVGSGWVNQIVSASKCPSLRVVFARGSGGELNQDQNYLAFKSSIESKLLTTELDYEFIDLDYPAIGIGFDNLNVTLGAYFGKGEAYEFGESVKSGVKKLDNLINSSSCPDTRYVIGGYSQGAMVVSRALWSLNPERIIFAATFGDPKIYLPEGKALLSLPSISGSGKNETNTGFIPAACKNKQLSDYRMYVPDCYAYEGLLGSYRPYQPEAFLGKLGTWCNKADIFCSSKLSINDHTSYISDNLYEDASKVIFAKIAAYYGIENKISSMHDTAILIDNTRSMNALIARYKSEAIRLATETFENGGRVALYEYGDVAEMALPHELCSFETCMAENFRSYLKQIIPHDGGDDKESLLSGSLNTMRSLNWRHGSTKSLVILTDNGFHSPDLDGVTVMDVITLSRKIDPVYIYVIGMEDFRNNYDEFTTSAGGRFVSIDENFSLITDEIMARFESLPKVEEETELLELPKLTVTDFRYLEDRVELQLSTDAERVLIILNDYTLGFTTEKKIRLSGLDSSTSNIVRLVPYSDSIRGQAVEIDLNEEKDISANNPDDILLTPTVPATGKR